MKRINRYNLNGYPDWYLASWCVVGFVWLANDLYTKRQLRKVRRQPTIHNINI